MPKEITHWTLAEKAYQNIDADSALKKIIREYKNLYLAGAVIADTPFYQLYGRDGKIMNRLGRGIHDNPDSYEPVARVINAYAPCLPDDVLSLMLGFLSHIHADSTFHPLVYYFSGSSRRGDKKSRNSASVFHHTLEAYLDIYYTQEFRLENRGLFSQVSKNLEMEEERFLNVLLVLYSQERSISISHIKKALRAHANIQRLFDNNAVKVILEVLNRIPGTDMDVYRSSFYPLRKPEPGSIFLHPFSYRHPVTGEKLQQSVKELETKAVRETLKIFRFVESRISDNSLAQTFSELRGPNLHTGMTDAGEPDMHCFSTGKDMMKVICQ